MSEKVRDFAGELKREITGIILETEHQELKDSGWGTSWERVDQVEKKEIEIRQLNLIIDAIPFFERLGGSENLAVVQGEAKTWVKLTSTRPDGEYRTIRRFEIFHT